MRVLYKKPHWDFWAMDKSTYESLNGAIKCCRFYQRMYGCETLRVKDDDPKTLEAIVNEK